MSLCGVKGSVAILIYERGARYLPTKGNNNITPKDDGTLLELTNWRPITLLNVDFKIASKAITKRFESILPSLIQYDQTGFVKDVRTLHRGKYSSYK